jgi:hypothetical protein
LQAQFAEHGYQFRTVQFWITDIRRSRQDVHNEIDSGKLSLDDFDGKFLTIFEKSPFESADSIAERLLIPHPIVLRHLLDCIGFKSFHLHWMPHLLTDDLREKRRDHVRAILPFLQGPERDSWLHLMTGDESWFFFNTSSYRA